MERETLMKPLILSLAIAIGLFRPVLLFVEFNPHIEAGYEAFAHIFVGVLLGIWLIYRDVEQDLGVNGGLQPWVMRTFWALAVIEVICAAVGVAMKRGLL